VSRIVHRVGVAIDGIDAVAIVDVTVGIRVDQISIAIRVVAEHVGREILVRVIAPVSITAITTSLEPVSMSQASSAAMSGITDGGSSLNWPVLRNPICRQNSGSSGTTLA
jgi:hypothetical protein